MSEPLPDLASLADALLDASNSDRFRNELAESMAMVENERDRLAAFDLFRYWLLFFDLSLLSTDDLDLQSDTGAQLLTSAIEAGNDAWAALVVSARIDELERLATTGNDGIELLEMLCYSSDQGARSFGLTSIESLGMRTLDDGGDSRPIERLLHGVGASDAAYRLEGMRKQRLSAASSLLVRPEHRVDKLNYRRIAIAGGNAQLRTTTASLLDRFGASVVQIPSSRESVRRERGVVQSLQGCDAVLLLVRQITHSTSDQVRRAADRLGIPVIYSNALSAVAIERQLMESARK